MALRARKFEHEIDSLTGCMILIEEADNDKVTHVILSCEDFEFEAKLATAVKLLDDIIGAEVDRRAAKIIRDDQIEGYPIWKRYDKKFKSATMRRYRALNRAIMWKAELSK